MAVKIFQLYSELYKVTGIGKVLMDIHEALVDFNIKIVGTMPYHKINPDFHIKEDDYVEFSNFNIFKGNIVIIHERKYLPIFWFLNKLLKYGINVIYIHHNEMYNKRIFSLFPNHVIGISDSGIRNLIDYFGVSKNHITKLHNCVRIPKDYTPKSKNFNNNEVTILYPARINSTKQQIEIVRRLNGKLDNRIRILFAGVGPYYEEFKEICKNSTQFIALGYRSDLLNLMQKSDYVMLYSKHEGLPISLIEATMTGTPIICNNVGGNCEIAIDGENAFVVDSWEELISCLNKLPEVEEEKFRKMSESAIKQYNDKFTFERFKKNYTNYINSLLN